jgi:hypothetical protein
MPSWDASQVFLFGTFAPALRASDSPMAIAYFLLVTFLPELPLRRVPALRSSVVFFTFVCAFLPYVAMTSPQVSSRLITIGPPDI